VSDATPVIKALVGNQAKTLAVVNRVGGGSVKQSELRVDYSYYGAATGRWQERPPADFEPLRPEWGDATGDLYLNGDVFLANVPRQVWRYELGGYSVLKKWLGYRQAKRRDNKALSLHELDELRAVVLRVAALLVLRPMLDLAYENATVASWSIDEVLPDSKNSIAP
jgi:hypothetical protein